VSTEQEAARLQRHLTDVSAVGGPEGVERLVRSLVAIMRDGGLSELDLKVDSLSVRLRGNATVAAPVDGAAQMGPAGAPAAPEPEAGHIISAPMIGTFYAASTPGAQPFITAGDRVSVGQVVGIIEAMKIMNEIVADQAGEVAAILATNGQPVEYGSPLVLLAPPGPGS
jgi:acetyl-CoA carboxylase biotin carboxyl carrier protein